MRKIGGRLSPIIVLMGACAERFSSYSGLAGSIKFLAPTGTGRNENVSRGGGQDEKKNSYRRRSDSLRGGPPSVGVLALRGPCRVTADRYAAEKSLHVVVDNRDGSPSCPSTGYP